MDQPVIIPQETVETNKPPIAALPIPSEANNHRDAVLVPAGLRRSSRKTKPPERYGDPISLPDVWTHPLEEGAMQCSKLARWMSDHFSVNNVPCNM